jgi:hypothetical protein
MTIIVTELTGTQKLRPLNPAKSFPERFPVFTGELPPKELQSLWSIFAIIAAVNLESFQSILEVMLGLREIGTGMVMAAFRLQIRAVCQGEPGLRSGTSQAHS